MIFHMSVLGEKIELCHSCEIMEIRSTSLLEHLMYLIFALALQGVDVLSHDVVV